MNVFIVFLVSGLWHGASWTFVIWGAIHGIYQIFGTLTLKPRNNLLSRLGLSEKSPLVIWIRRTVTFLLVTFAWLFFRANSTSDAFNLLKVLFSGKGGFADTLDAMGFTQVGIVFTVLSILVLLMIDRLVTYEDGEDGSDALCERGGYVYFVWIIMLAWMLLLSNDMTSTFIYFQF